MIKLENIIINFDSKELINQSEMNIAEGKITLITGPSGSGKTTILNLLGLLGDNKNIQCNYYLFNEKIDRQDLKRISVIKRNVLSYVFQDYNTFDTMSILDNFKIQFYVCGKKYNKKAVFNYLSLVKLSEVNINKKIISLSGGEKQRLAIALALVKEPKIILFDEPTANLDKENTELVVEIIHKLKSEGKTVVISTHHKDIYNGDVFYSIQDKKLIKEIEDEDIIEKPLKIVNKAHHFYTKYGVLKFNSHLIVNFLFVSLLALVIGYTSYNLLSTKHANEIQSEQVKMIADNEIFLINDWPKTREDNIIPAYYAEINDDLNTEIIEKINTIEAIESFYYYKCFSVWAYVFDEGGNRLQLSNPDYGNMTIKKDGQELTSVNLSERNDSYGLTSWDEDNAESQCTQYNQSIQNGIYITSSFANALGIQDINNVSLNFDIAIPIAKLRAQATSIKGMVEAGSPYFVSVRVEYPIKGIINSDISGKHYYDDYPANHIYINYEELNRLQQEAQTNNQQSLDGYYDANFHMGPIFSREKTFYNFDLLSNALVIRVESQEKMEEVQKELQLLNEYFVVKTKNDSNMELKEIDNQNKFMNITIPIITIAVLVIMISVVYYFRNKKDKHNLALLKANGINHLTLASFSEIAIMWIIQTILAVITELIFIIIINSRLKLGIPIDVYTIIIPIAISSIVSICPILISYLMNRKIDVALLIRSS